MWNRDGKIWYSEEEYNKLKKKLDELIELAEENKDTAQYRGICDSILGIARG